MVQWCKENEKIPFAFVIGLCFGLILMAMEMHSSPTGLQPGCHPDGTDGEAIVCD